MLWSLLKIVVFVALVGAAAWGAGLLLEADGGVRVSLADIEFTLGPLVAVIALVLLVIAIWLALKIAGLIVAFIRFLAGDETAITRYFQRNRERKGYDALAEGMMALASGDGRQALTKAEKADRYLQRPDLTTLLTAQAAELAGDRAKAEEAYKRLLEDDKTRFVGVRGIMKQKLEAGDTATALKLAEKAFALKPKHEDTQDVLLKLQAGEGDWSGARKTLGAKLKHGGLPRDVHPRSRDRGQPDVAGSRPRRRHGRRQLRRAGQAQIRDACDPQGLGGRPAPGPRRCLRADRPRGNAPGPDQALPRADRSAP